MESMAHQAVVDFFYLFKYWLSITAENMYYDHKASAITTRPKLADSYRMISLDQYTFVESSWTKVWSSMLCVRKPQFIEVQMTGTGF